MHSKESKEHTLANKMALNAGPETGIWWMNVKGVWRE